MADFTVEQLEALKEGTTEGPWEWYWDQGIISLRGPGGEPIATDLTLDAADVLEASRALVDALIAEKQAHAELRKRIEALRAECKTVVDDNGKCHDGYAANDVAAFIEECHYNALTRILEGEA